MLTIAEARKPYKLIAFALALCFCIVSTLCVAFASPSISDADISFNVKAYYVKYAYTTTWQTGYVLNSSGEVVVNSDETYRLTSAFVPVDNVASFFMFLSAGDFHTLGVLAVAFYDSEQVFIEGSYSYYNPDKYFIDVPSGASYVRITQRQGPTVRLCLSPQTVDSTNYRYVWGQFEGVTIDSDGYVTIPYQTYGFLQICLDFRFFSSVYQFSNIGMKVLSEYSDTTVYEGLLNYGEGQVLAEPYTIVGDELNTTAVASSTSNPAKFAFNIPFSEFSGFLLYIPVNIPNGNVSTSIKVKVYDFQLDGEDVSARLEIDRTLDQLNELADQLAVPTPDIDVNDILDNAFSGTDMTITNNFFAILYNNDIVPKMLIIAVSIGLLGYILFGKKES